MKFQVLKYYLVRFSNKKGDVVTSFPTLRNPCPVKRTQPSIPSPQSLLATEELVWNKPVFVQRCCNLVSRVRQFPEHEVGNTRESLGSRSPQTANVRFAFMFS